MIKDEADVALRDGRAFVISVNSLTHRSQLSVACALYRGMDQATKEQLLDAFGAVKVSESTWIIQPSRELGERL